VTAGLRLLLTTDAVGGVWTYSLDLADLLARRGIQVTLAVLGPPTSESKRAAAGTIAGLVLVDTGLALDWLAEDRLALRHASLALAELARDMDADLVQLHSPALACGGDWTVPVVSVMHSCVASWWGAVRGTGLPDDFKWRAELCRWGMLRSDRVVAPSQAFADAVARIYGLKQAPAVVYNSRLPGTIEPSAFPSDSVFTAGRLWDEGKNIAVLDRVAAGLPCPVRAAGPTSGPNGAAVELRHAVPLGELDEAQLSAELARRPIFASAALYEPFGLSVLEAAQAGCALVLSDIPTFRELWGGAALFADPRDPAAMRLPIERLLSDRVLRAELADRARARAEYFTPATMAEAMLAMFGELVPLDERSAA
jgi:glycosyltransferase involved in cell wall biosynthesis